MLTVDRAALQNVALSAMQTQDDVYCYGDGLEAVEVQSNTFAAAKLGLHAGIQRSNARVFCDRYQILQVLGRGGFGVVFLAKDVTLPEKPLCVIKQLSIPANRASALQKAREGFIQEARALRRLGSHDQIPQLLDYFQVDGEFYLVQEYIDGQTLMAEVTRNGPFSEHQVIDFLHKILPVVKYVHRNRMIHRDIKPANIIQQRVDGSFVLIDFGSVRQLPKESCNTKPFTHFVGTLGYAPPERFAYVSYGNDIFALGMTCLHLLTGILPIHFRYDSSGHVNWQEVVQVSPFFSNVLNQMLTLSLHQCDESIAQVIQSLVERG